jgi:ABC-type multidrug transport system fused ATPase/permease subunit
MPISALISGFVFAFIKGWRMSLVMITLLPPIGVAAFIFAYTIHNKEKKK